MSTGRQKRQPAGRPSGGEYATAEHAEAEIDLQESSSGPDRAMPAGFVRVRHESAPAPNSCRWCGRERESHGLFFTRSVGNHYYVDPTPQQRLARMLARTGGPS